ncbi:MAG: GHKL domain-containing protein, partial [candidate division Zixibacteria bacterium]|nr:GHKL domain-containing protein [candidate division Zixibacteria bacterium]
ERLIGKAEEAEFRLKDYNRAAELYRLALNGAKENNTRADLLMRIARVSIRAENFSQALEAFRSVSEKYNQSRLPGGLPGGLASRLELIGLTIRTGDTVGAIEMTHNLYKDLLASVWTLNKSQFNLARKKIESDAANMSSFFAGGDISAISKIDRLSQEADSLISRTDFLLELSNLLSAVVLDLKRDHLDNINLNSRRIIEDNNHRYLLLLAGGAEHTNSDIICFGALIDDDVLLNTVISNIVNSLPLGENHSLIISNDVGERLYGEPPPDESRLTATRGFEGSFPSWMIELHQVDLRFFEQILSSRRSIYVYALVIVMIALTLGAIMTARIMSRELELARLKSDFVSTVSHEFRSPLTSIRQLSEMLQSGRVQSEERRNHYYDVILEQSERLSLMVSNILDLVRIDEKRFRLNREYVRVEELLGAIITRASQMVGDKEAPVRLCIADSLPAIMIDPDAITLVMNNLIDNAIKYSGESMEVTVKAFHDDNDLFITVKDNGIGIPKNETEKVFERFYRRGDELTRRVKGSGLGLSLVRELVGAHGGTVNVVSEVNKGSLFTIRLPLTKDESNKNG